MFLDEALIIQTDFRGLRSKLDEIQMFLDRVQKKFRNYVDEIQIFLTEFRGFQIKYRCFQTELRRNLDIIQVFFRINLEEIQKKFRRNLDIIQ